jgi:uncharacterized protein (TIGR03118 family)
MNTFSKCGIALLLCAGLYAQDTATNSYKQTNLVSDVKGMATTRDTHLVNPWGLSRTANSPWWAADNGTGVSTLYTGAGKRINLVVQVQKAGGGFPGSPSGTAAFNNSFVFVTLDGAVEQWDSSTSTIIEHVNSSASYTGCTVAKNGTGSFLYVANSNGGPNGGIEVYNTSYAQVTPTGTFTDPMLPTGYTPYGIQTVGTDIYVTYASATGASTGNGWVSAFDANGNFKLRLAAPSGNNYMSFPWGVAKAPKTGFGKFSGRILVGMESSGKIAAFNATTGAFLGFVQDSAGKPIANPGLWAIYFGNGNASNGPKTTLYFAAGIDGYAHGLFGSIVHQ